MQIFRSAHCALLSAAFFIFGTAGIAGTQNSDPSTARVTEAKGTVYRRGFVDSNKEIWGNPEPAAKGDSLHEGMQLGTGTKSWAQLTWEHCKTRAWSNSVFAVAPNQRLVYVVGGEVLFQLDKKRPNKQEYMIWTNLLQARVKGTTVLVQSTPDNSKISVLEGTIDVVNRIDKSVMTLKPGVVYEIQAKDRSPSSPLSGNSLNPSWVSQIATGGSIANSVGLTNSTLNTAKNSTVGNVTGAVADTVVNVVENTVGNVVELGTKTIAQTGAVVDKTLGTVDGLVGGTGLFTAFKPGEFATELLGTGMKKVEVFETLHSTTSLYQLGASRVLESSILNNFESVLPSASLIQGALGDLPTGDRLFSSRTQIVRLPVMEAYAIGQTIGKTLNLPTSSLVLWPPSKVIGAQPTLSSTLQGVGSPLEIVSNIPLGRDGRIQIPFSDVTLGPQLPGGGNIPGGNNLTAIVAQADTINVLGTASALTGRLGITGPGGLLNGGLLNGGLLGGVGGLLGGLGLPLPPLLGF